MLGQLWRQRADYGPFYVSTLLLGCVTYSQGNWMPTHLIRFFHMDVREVGLSLGVMLMIGALLGTLLGPALVEWRVRRGDRSPHLRAVLIISALLVPAMAGPAMPTLPAALVMMSVYYVLQTAFVSPMVTGVQILAPNRLRGVAVALWALIGNIGGLGIGVALVGAIADWLFPNQPDGIGKAMMIVGMTASGLCALWAAWCLSRKAVVTARVAVDG